MCIYCESDVQEEFLPANVKLCFEYVGICFFPITNQTNWVSPEILYIIDLQPYRLERVSYDQSSPYELYLKMCKHIH